MRLRLVSHAVVAGATRGPDAIGRDGGERTRWQLRCRRAGRATDLRGSARRAAALRVCRVPLLRPIAGARLARHLLGSEVLALTLSSRDTTTRLGNLLCTHSDEF